MALHVESNPICAAPKLRVSGSERVILAAQIGLLETCKATIVLLYSRKLMKLAIKKGTIFFLLRNSTLQRRAGRNLINKASFAGLTRYLLDLILISLFFFCLSHPFTTLISQASSQGSSASWALSSATSFSRRWD